MSFVSLIIRCAATAITIWLTFYAAANLLSWTTSVESGAVGFATWMVGVIVIFMMSAVLLAVIWDAGSESGS